MFKRTKKISKRLGLNKERCTEVSSNDTTTNNISIIKPYSKVEETHAEQQTKVPPTIRIERVNTIGSTESDETEGTDEDEETITKQRKSRPVLTKCLSAPTATKNEFGILDNTLSKQLSLMDTGNLELLLSMETQARMDAQAKREEEELQRKHTTMLNTSPPRPTKIKFELPVTPPRSRSPANARLQYPRARPVQSLPDEAIRYHLPINKTKQQRTSWRQLFGDREEDVTIPQPITLDSRVRLKKRPLPTFGVVKFIGGVEFGHGEYIGIELDHGVGNCDGSIDGVRYFDTDHNYGMFCTRNDLEVVTTE